MSTLFSFVSGFPEMPFIFYVPTTIRNALNGTSKNDVIGFTCFFDQCTRTTQNKDIALKFCTDAYCLYEDLEHTFRFLITSKFWKILAFASENESLSFESQNWKIKHPRQMFCRTFNFASFGIFGCVYFKSVNKNTAVFGLQTFAVFLTKMTKQVDTKMPISQTFMDGFF